MRRQCREGEAAAGQRETGPAQALDDRPQSVLRISCLPTFGRRHVLPIVAGLSRTYPELAIELDLTERLTDPAGGRCDAAIRIGRQPDSGLIATRIGSQYWIVCASPACLDHDGQPDCPAALGRHRRIGKANEAPGLGWSRFLPPAGQARPLRRCDAGASGHHFGSKLLTEAVAMSGKTSLELPSRLEFIRSIGGAMRAQAMADRFRVVATGMDGVTAVLAESTHRFPRHTHDQYGIGLILQGAQVSWSGRGMVEAGAGDIITVNPGEVHDGATIGERGRNWAMLYLDPPLVGAAALDIQGGAAPSCEFLRPVFKAPGWAGRFRRLFEGIGATGNDQTALAREQALLVLVAALIDRRPARPPAPPAIGAARQRIDDDPACPVTLGELAREAGLSRFQLIRGFTRATGLTPHAYLLQRRIHLARRLIAGGMALAEVAAASGFADQSHLTRMFRRTLGLSPGAYGKRR